MLKVAVCDDEPAALRALGRAVEKYFAHSGRGPASVTEFAAPMSFMDALEKNAAFDIVLLDIMMPGLSGLELAEAIRRRGDDTAIIFLTASRDFAVDAFALKAVHYLVKPFTDEQLAEALGRAFERFGAEKSQRLLLYLKNGAAKAVGLSRIIYIESVGSVREIVTMDGVFEERRKKLSELADELDGLSPGQFITPYRGYIVNQEAIETITTNEIILTNGKRVPLKAGSYRAVRDAFFAWSFQRSK